MTPNISMDTLVSHGNGLARALPVHLPDDEPYILLPESLALDLRDSPLAVGIYLLVGRIFLVQQGPIPLSAADIQAYDGSGELRRGAILRALARLFDGGYLLRQSKQAGNQKSTYLPGWGLVNAAPRPWSLDAAGLGRPRSVRAIRVPRTLIDVCMGRLTPHLRHPALIERYVTRPPVSLRDLGAYGLSWAGLTMLTPALARLGLVNESGVLPPPTWASLLARISQQPLFDADPQAPCLSPRGLQRAGFPIADTGSTDETPPLFFVPSELIGPMIPSMIPPPISPGIATPPASEQAPSAAASAETAVADVAEVTTGTHGNSGNSGSEATPAATDAPDTSRRSVPSPTRHKRSASDPSKASATSSPTTFPPAADVPAVETSPYVPTAAEELLRDLGVYPSIASQHRDLPVSLVERAHAIAQRLPGRRSLAATIAQLLHEEQVSPGWLRQARPDLFLGPLQGEGAHTDSTEMPEEEAAYDDADNLCRRAHALLGDVLSSQLSPFIGRAQIALDAGQIVVSVPSWFSRTERAEVNAAVSIVAAQLGCPVCLPMEQEVLPSAPQVTSVAHAPVRAAAPMKERPDWIPLEQWEQLHLLARGALSGSRWIDGEIVGSGPVTTRILRGNLASLVARLRPTVGA